MRCRQCGLEVDNEKAFCPVCGAPMKVTADYDYIQAEIANKVDRYFNEDNAKTEEEADALDLNEDDDRDDLAKTKDVFGKDSIFDDEEDDLDEDDPDEDIDEFIEFDEDPDEYPEDRRSENRSRRSSSAHDKRMYDRPGERPVRRSSSGSQQRRKKKKNQTFAKVITVLIIIVIIAAAAVGVMSILGLFNRSSEMGNNAALPAKATLTSNLNAGQTYTSPVEVVLSNELEGNIFYTLDGSEPSINSKMYTEPFTITGKDVPGSYPNVNLRAVSYSSNSEKSGELNVTFALEYDEKDAPAPVETEPPQETTPEITDVEAPAISPESGDYTEDTRIVVTALEGADIYYTIDGSTPDSTSERYTGPVKMPAGTSTFSAVCVYRGITSPVASRSYNLDYGYPVPADAAVTNAALWLFNNGYTIDYDFNTYDGYIVPTNLGPEDIGDYTYYIIQLDFYTEDGTQTETEYVGIGVNYGGGEHLGKDGDTYYYN